MRSLPGSFRLTPRGEGGVSVLALPRPEAEAWLRSRKLGAAPAPGGIRFLRLPLPGSSPEEEARVEVEALLVGHPAAPWVELHLPGNPVLCGSLAEEGWRRERGLYGEGISPLGEECLRMAQEAPTSRGAALALSQLVEGRWLSLLESWSPASPEDRPLLEELRVAREQGERLAGLLVPTRILLRGPTNAGKSTLFNLLLGRERVRTGPQAGLTLDPVSESVEGLGWPFVLVDTAGERSVGRGLEKEAISLGRDLAAGSLVVELRSLSQEKEGCGWEGPSLPGFVCHTHADLGPDPKEEGLVFDLKGGDPDLMREAFFAKVLEVLGREAFPEPEGFSCFLTDRQRTLGAGILEEENLDRRCRALEELKGGH